MMCQTVERIFEQKLPNMPKEVCVYKWVSDIIIDIHIYWVVVGGGNSWNSKGQKGSKDHQKD